MNLDGKVSQGVPIGNDISFLLAEVVLARVDNAIKSVTSQHSFRWFDDYELAFNTHEQAEEGLKKLNRELGKFRLRLNANKTAIVRLPQPSQDEWQETLREAGTVPYMNSNKMVKYFDIAFRLREQFPDAPILLYALGILFNINCPRYDVAQIAQGCITQALLCEPGAAQKAFALLSFWHVNGLTLDEALITATINQMIIRHEAGGFSSDCAWALAFCLEHGYTLDSKAGRVLCSFDDDCIALQALHMEQRGLLPKGFKNKEIVKGLKDADLDREHWLIAYETVRHDLLSVCTKAVYANPLFSEFLRHRVTFYRTRLPAYAMTLHPGGAPGWVVKSWVALLEGESERVRVQREESLSVLPILKLIHDDLEKTRGKHVSPDDAVASLMELFDTGADVSELGTFSG